MTVTDEKDPEKNIKAHSQALSALGNFFPPPNSHHCQYECSCTIVRDVGRHNIWVFIQSAICSTVSINPPQSRVNWYSAENGRRNWKLSILRFPLLLTLVQLQWNQSTWDYLVTFLQPKNCFKMQHSHLMGQNTFPPYLNSYAPRLLPLIMEFLSVQKVLFAFLYEIFSTSSKQTGVPVTPIELPLLISSY